MAETTPIPVRIPKVLLPRIDAAAKRLGYNRARLIAFCITTFLEDFEVHDIAMMPLNWKELLDRLDGRTRLGRETVIERRPGGTIVRYAKPGEVGGTKTHPPAKRPASAAVSSKPGGAGVRLLKKGVASVPDRPPKS